jgi:hypothetical protein
VSAVIEHSTWAHPFAPLDPMIARVAEYWLDLPCGSEERLCTTMPVGLLIGEQPGPTNNPAVPLWPYPPRSAGGRLHAMSGIPMADYLAMLARVNIALQPVARWNRTAARDRVVTLLDDLPDGARVVLVGARALDAYNDVFGQGVRLDWFGREGWSIKGLTTTRVIAVTAVPHPSGRNPMYNDPATVAAARRAVRWAAGIEDK